MRVSKRPVRPPSRTSPANCRASSSPRLRPKTPRASVSTSPRCGSASVPSQSSCRGRCLTPSTPSAFGVLARLPNESASIGRFVRMRFLARASAVGSAIHECPMTGPGSVEDVAGVVACRGHAKTAGSPEGKPDPGWVCGPRHGHPKERVCLDFSPDLPPGGGPWTCHFEHEAGASGRVCVKKASAHVGQKCAAAPCPIGTGCVEDRCLPESLKTECWGDKDCPSGRCELTRCKGQPG